MGGERERALGLIQNIGRWKPEESKILSADYEEKGL